MNMIRLPDQCLQCGKPYKKKDADLVSKRENEFIFHLTCEHCCVSTIMRISTGRNGILSISSLTDAGKKDLEKLREGKLVSTDDVIEAYQSIKKFANA